MKAGRSMEFQDLGFHRTERRIVLAKRQLTRNQGYSIHRHDQFTTSGANSTVSSTTHCFWWFPIQPFSFHFQSVTTTFLALTPFFCLSSPPWT